MPDLSTVDERGVDEGRLLKFKDVLRVEQERSRSHSRKWKAKELAARRKTECVYFIQCEQFVKIGFTSIIVGRLADIQSGNPFPCVLLGTLPGGQKLEWKLHQEFAEYRHVGEWFHLTTDLHDKIKTLLEEAVA